MLPSIRISFDGIHLTDVQGNVYSNMLQSHWGKLNHVDWYLSVLAIFLLLLAFRQMHAFSRPPPVPKKRLPKRPIIQIIFKPDDITISSRTENELPPTPEEALSHEMPKESPLRIQGPFSALRSAYRLSRCLTMSSWNQGTNRERAPIHENANYTTQTRIVVEDDEEDDITWDGDEPHSMMHHDDSRDKPDHTAAPPPPPPPPPPTTNDANQFSYDLNFDNLPDSFAPLISSSYMEVLKHHLTTDLIHAIHTEGNIKLRPGRFEIPLDKDPSRPQLIIQVPSSGCKITAVGVIGSDGFSLADDLNPNIPTTQRCLPMVKRAGLIFDPPLPLHNVAPTLIHFPTLFEDNTIRYKLRRIQIVKLALDFIYSASSFIEKMLWIIESKCQIHLGKVTIAPIYKGSEESKLTPEDIIGAKDEEEDSQRRSPVDHVHEPQWRLSLSFSGHLLLFGWIPVPFVSVTLPTFIIPQPHTLLKYLASKQPLASARIRRERIAEKRILLAVSDAMESWSLDVAAVATSPALSIDWTLPGGLAVAVEAMHGRDITGGSLTRDTIEAGTMIARSLSGDTLSSWNTHPEAYENFKRRRHMTRNVNRIAVGSPKGHMQSYDANNVVPWKLELSLQGYFSHEKVYVNISKCIAKHDPPVNADSSAPHIFNGESLISLSGSVEVWRPIPGSIASKIGRSKVSHYTKSASSVFPSVCSTLLFSDPPKAVPSKARVEDFLEYDYAFDFGKDTRIDALSLSVGATHPMLKGGTIVTTILESIYAGGSITAREGALLDMTEVKRKRYVLRHLPAIDFTTGIQNAYIPEESMSYSDDGQTFSVPGLTGGRIVIRLVGGFADDDHSAKTDVSGKNVKDSIGLPKSDDLNVADGIKAILDFGVASLVLNSESKVKEIPELDIFDEQKLESLLSGSINGRISCHLRTQDVSNQVMGSLGKNTFNPLEAYEVDFSGSSVALKLKEGNSTLGHRRIILPAESSFGLVIQHSVVDMALDGVTQCELRWDFQGSSPILQVASLGQSPSSSSHEEREQIALLIPYLRQGRFNLSVSPVGGLKITEAKTSRDNGEGLYDWKFFNAIVSPDEDSPLHLYKVVHDKRTMNKLLQIMKLVNADIEKTASYILQQVWRAKDIFDQEGVSDPGKAIPGHQMARLVSLFLCGNTTEVDNILPMIRRVVSGEGLDVVKVKDLLHKNVSFYERWAPEIDRAVRWFEVLLGPIEAPKPYVESEVPPLSETQHHASRFDDIPSIKNIYATLLDKMHLPLDPSFSSLVSRIAPYLSYRQVEYILQVRAPTDWRPSDLRRLRYVYSIKKKVLDISEFYGGLTFLPQSFFVSIFVAEATRSSLRAGDTNNKLRRSSTKTSWPHQPSNQQSTLSKLRKRRTYYKAGGGNLSTNLEESDEFYLSPAGRVASQPNIPGQVRPNEMKTQSAGASVKSRPAYIQPYEVGDSLLGPQDVAILLQAGLTSSMKASTVVQLNQRMLLDLMASQPKSFSVAVLAEMGNPGGQGSLRGLTSALLALLDLDQTSFTKFHRLDMHALLESWINGIKIPRREDYLAGGRWARQSYYGAIFNVAKSILDDAEIYLAFKGHLQRVRHHHDTDPLPTPRETTIVPQPDTVGIDIDDSSEYKSDDPQDSVFLAAIKLAKVKIAEADRLGAHAIVSDSSPAILSAKSAYNDAFDACKCLLKHDKLFFYADWFKQFYRRNYDALMVKSVYDNVLNGTDNVRDWCLKMSRALPRKRDDINPFVRHVLNIGTVGKGNESLDRSVFSDPQQYPQKILLDSIIDLLFYSADEKDRIRKDPLVRLLIPIPEGRLEFTIVTAMGVITEGKKGLELADSFCRLERNRGIKTIRADTGIARSLEYNANKIEEAIEAAVKLKKPFGLLGYSQGCTNSLAAESLLNSGSPLQQSLLNGKVGTLVCRQLLFSAANGSTHGASTEAKIHRLIIMGEEFFKYQQGYFSKAFISFALETMTNILDSSAFQKFLCGGGGTFLYEGCKAFWRESQQLENVPTCVLRGVIESHTTPESLEMIANLLTKQSGSPLHDSQVHVYDAVGHPVYTQNRNGKILRLCDMGGAVQRTHHWSPLSAEVEFVRTKRDIDQGSFICAKDRHVIPWVEVNARFGIIEFADDTNIDDHNDNNLID